MTRYFLSHAASDAALAAFVEEQLRRLVPNGDVFRTSRTGQIPVGDEWFRVTTDNLRTADCYIVLLTPNSVDRPWMWFEAGAGWMSTRPLFPVLAALSASEVPEPLKFFQLYSLEAPDEASMIFKELGGVLPDPAMFASAVRTFAKSIRQKHNAAEGWKGFAFDRYFMAWDGPVAELTTSIPIPTPEGLISRLAELGIHTQHGIIGDLTREYAAGLRDLWAVDFILRQRHHILMPGGGQILLVRAPDDIVA